MPTKIETHLSPEQLLEFFRRCAQTKAGTTLRTIQALAEEFGVKISLMSATAVRDGPLNDYLEELKAKSERAQQIAAFAKEGLSMADAACVRLSESVFDDLMAEGKLGALTAEERDIYSKIIARARAGDERSRLGDQREKKLEADLKLRDEQVAALTSERQERDRKKAELLAKIETAKTTKGGLTKESLARIEQEARLL